MKKYWQLLVVVLLVLAVVGIARANPAWAGSFASNKAAGLGASQPKSIVVTGSGFFNVGGICTMEIAYKVDGLKNNVDSEVPVKESQKVPFDFSPETLYYPGCHVVHFKNDKLVNVASSQDGSWKVCFGVRPDVEAKIYYYEDEPADGVRVWKPLPTTITNNLACTDALYTGVYMPAGKPPEGADIPVTGGGQRPTPPPGGSIQPPAPSTRITQSGVYSIGGICTLEVIYKQPELSNDVYVELPTKDTQTVPFPDDKGLIYLPGCHVLHYEPLMYDVTEEQGQWKICFAAIPGKTTTIYYYSDDGSKVAPPWIELPTTIEGGMACAPAMHTGVYAPTAK